MPFVILTGKSILTDLPPAFPSTSVFYEFPTVWDYQGYAGSWLTFFFLGFLVLHMFTSEVSYKTMRQNIITGYTKKEYFLAKLGVIITISILSTVLYFISSLVLGMFHTPGWDWSLAIDNNYACLRYFLMSMGYLTFAFLIANLFRTGGLSMFFYFAYGLVLEPIIKGIHGYFLRNSSMNLWPMNLIEDNMPFPLFKTSNEFIKTQSDFEMLNATSTIYIGSIIYIALFIYLSWLLFMKKDV